MTKLFLEKKYASQDVHTSTPRGFTLIETLFAVLIFSAALVSLLTIAGKGISATGQVKNETVAFYLAQEGLEAVRNIRDTNFVSGNLAWDDGFSQTTVDCSANIGCYLEFGNGTGVPVLSPNSTPGTDEVFFTNGVYTNLSGTETGFFRSVKVVPEATGNAIDEYRVVSTVTWQSRGIRRKVELTTVIKKWQ